MMHPMQHQTLLPESRGSFHEARAPGFLLHTSVVLRLHVGTVLSQQDGRAGHPRTLALTGHVHLPELQAQIAFRNHNGNGVGNGHAEEQWAVAAIVPRHFRMAIPTQYLTLSAGDENDIWALTPAPDHDPPWIEHYAGQLEGGSLRFDQHIPVPVTLEVMFASEECQSGRGARVDVAGELRFERSVRMRLLFRDPGQSTALPSESDSGEAVLIAAGSRVPIPRQTVSSMAGRDALMTLRVIEDDGRIVWAEHALVMPARKAS